jgi:hypothetical protein
MVSIWSGNIFVFYVDKPFMFFCKALCTLQILENILYFCWGLYIGTCVLYMNIIYCLSCTDHVMCGPSFIIYFFLWIYEPLFHKFLCFVPHICKISLYICNWKLVVLNFVRLLPCECNFFREGGCLTAIHTWICLWFIYYIA